MFILINNEDLLHSWEVMKCRKNSANNVKAQFVAWDWVGEGTPPWATSCFGPFRFFLNQKKRNIFCLLHLFVKVIYWIQILLKKNKFLYCFSYNVTFSMSKINFWFFRFIETNSLNIDSFTNEN